ncbi:crotonase/enoyl-CoA hydratase family protein [Sphingobium limneticum]|uniref:Crotonase/enoyl-CoA hydratase family protein n=1 Tax=Sphingobium limneticum TaxID=1007511 RepID=A0A5J5I113_9SPHN|nr:crotonase/enoyl-CoA hydratase family protein [Sphingobium limneticum]KAA9015837.1 crotonase/enoyl-CoA hydratase family protein [Sphingobium limneticum]KAA9028250.1 crotonase/enoyl-CoA hydratase family protein [Sphingobium limneticum]
MIDSGRFNPVRDEAEAASHDDVSGSAELPPLAVTETPSAAGLESAFRQSTLFDLGQIDVRWDADLSTLWAFMTPLERPNSNMGLIRDTMAWQRESKQVFGGKQNNDGSGLLKFMVLGSRFPGVFNLGGDLEMFAECIQRRDRATLLKYGIACCEIVDRIWHCNDMNIINIGLAQGDALGGGLEALMCFDVIIAERQARFGLPEVLFGLFPGMGAYSILSRRVGPVLARHMLTDGRIYTAEEMCDMGIVNQVVETGEGEAATAQWIKDHASHHAGYVGINRAGRRVNPMTLEELIDIVETWTDTALALSDRDLRMMRRLAAAQTRLRG